MWPGLWPGGERPLSGAETEDKTATTAEPRARDPRQARLDAADPAPPLAAPHQSDKIHECLVPPPPSCRRHYFRLIQHDDEPAVPRRLNEMAGICKGTQGYVVINIKQQFMGFGRSADVVSLRHSNPAPLTPSRFLYQVL